MSYAVLAGAQARSFGGYSVRAIAREDMEPIRRWRNAQLRVLRQACEIWPEEQRRYFDELVLPTFEDRHPSQVLLTLLLDGERVGYGGLTHIDWGARRAELAFLGPPERSDDPERPDALERYGPDFRAFLALAIDGIAFADLGLHRVFSETFDVRPHTIAILESFGFVAEGRMRDHVRIDGRYADSLLHGYVARQPTGSAGHADRTRGSVLVTSAAAKIPLLRAVRAALDEVGPPDAALHAGDADGQAISRYFADAFWTMPRLDELTPEDAIAYCERHRIGLVIPTRDGELPYWAAGARALAHAGVDVLVPDADAVQTCLDKLRFARTLLAAGEPAIPTAASPDELDAERYVVKERFGAGGKRLGLGLDRDAAVDHAASLDEPVFQPFVPGSEFSVDLYVARDRSLQGVIARRRELVRDGESQVTATVRDPALERRCARIAALLGLRGHAVIQVLVDGERHHIVECNPRFGGASTLGLAAGLQTFVWAYLEAHGEPLTSRPFRRASGERRQVRFAADRILPA